MVNCDFFFLSWVANNTAGLMGIASHVESQQYNIHKVALNNVEQEQCSKDSVMVQIYATIMHLSFVLIIC